MIEAVGWRHFDEFFRRCDELLADDGLMLLQAITIDDGLYEIEKGARSFANTHVFPGGCLPSRKLIAECIARDTEMREIWSEDITPTTRRPWPPGASASSAPGSGSEPTATTSASTGSGRST